MVEALSLVVIRSLDTQRAVAFYEALGLRFDRERHGQGPEHWAAEVGPTVLEIYPLTSPSQATTGMRLGFRVPCVQEAVAELSRRGAAVVSGPKEVGPVVEAVLRDGDGHTIHLTQTGHLTQSR
jgi:catechol 2,3-dioxygenase-like lactoylglutathione lyase family enzyme